MVATVRGSVVGTTCDSVIGDGVVRTIFDSVVGTILFHIAILKTFDSFVPCNVFVLFYSISMRGPKGGPKGGGQKGGPPFVYTHRRCHAQD